MSKFSKLLDGFSYLIIPLAALLLLQWPLRDWVQAYSRPANDLAQILFALFAAASIAAATLANTHLSLHQKAKILSKQNRLTLACITPWVAVMVWFGTPMVWQSVMQFEKFPDTATPGFFIVKLAVLILLGLTAWAYDMSHSLLAKNK